MSLCLWLYLHIHLHIHNIYIERETEYIYIYVYVYWQVSVASQCTPIFEQSANNRGKEAASQNFHNYEPKGPSISIHDRFTLHIDIHIPRFVYVYTSVCT